MFHIVYTCTTIFKGLIPKVNQKVFEKAQNFLAFEKLEQIFRDQQGLPLAKFFKTSCFHKSVQNASVAV